MKYKFVINRNTSKLILGMSLLFLLSTCSVVDRKVNEKIEPTIPEFAVLSVRDYLPSALALSQEWHSDAYLLDLKVDVKPPHGIPNFEGITFEFRSPSNKKKILSVFCKKNCRSKELTTAIEQSQCIPLEISDSLLESGEAFELGLKSGGVDYVNRENAYASMYLDRNYPRCNGTIITWEVQFGTYDPSEQVLFVFDAVSGELLETR